MAPWLRTRLVLAASVLALTTLAAPAWAQPVDPFLGVPILTVGAPAPGQPLNIDKSGTIVTFGDGQHAVDTPASAGGYPQNVLDSIQNFSAAPFSFSLKSIFKADGTAANFGAAITGARTDTTGQSMAGGGGAFTVNNDGTFSFVPGTDFTDVDPGQKVRSTVTYIVHGTNGGGLSKDSVGKLVVEIARALDGTLTTTAVGSDFDDYGPSSKPIAPGKIFVPDLKRFVTGLLRFASVGSPGNGVTITSDANITTVGAGADGIRAKSIGDAGAWGRDGSISHGSDRGDPGGLGGPVSVAADGRITTVRDESVGVLGWSVGGRGGNGGEGGTWRDSSAGGPGASGGPVTISGAATITTFGARASGILALSQGGNGGDGGGGATFYGGGSGSAGGQGGTVNVQGSWNITTSGEAAHGIWAKSFGGVAGSGGNGGWAGSAPGSGGVGTEGGTVTVVSGGEIRTGGANAYGIFAQSVGGFGGNGGDGSNIFYGTGGSGDKAGSGGHVNVINNGKITTTGAGSHGIFAQSVGGGGGGGGDAASLVGLGSSGAGGGNGGNVRVTNNGIISATGLGARGIYAQSVGGGGGDGGDGSGLVGIGGGGSSTSDGGTVNVANTGTIISSSNAIFAQSIGGGGGSGGQSKGLVSIGGDGGAGGDSDTVSVSSHGNLSTSGKNATALFAESVGGGGGNGGNSVAAGLFFSAAIGGKGGVGGKGSDVKVGVNVDSGAVDPITGRVTTTGDNSNGILAQSVGGGGGNGGYAISASVGIGASASLALGGEGGTGNAAKSASVYFGDVNSRIATSGENSNGIVSQSIGGGGGNGGMAIAAAAGTQFAAALSFGGNGGTGGDAGIANAGSAANPLLGQIATSGAHSYGVLAQSVGGGGGNGGMSIAVAVGGKGTASLAFGGDGGAAGTGNTVTLNSQALVSTQGHDSHGLFAQSVGGGGGSGGAAIAGGVSGGNSIDLSFGGDGGGGGNAGAVTLTSRGLALATLGDKSYGILAQSIGGGGGDGGFSVSGGIDGANSVNVGIGGNGGTASDSGVVTVVNSSAITTKGDDSHAIFAQSTGGGGGSGGFSVAGGISKSGSLEAAIGGRGGKGGNADAVTVTNTANNIQTSGDRSYGVLAQSIGGGGGDGGFAVAGGVSKSTSIALGVGGKGGDGGNAGIVGVTSSTAISTEGELSHGIFAQSVGGGGGSGGFSISGAVSSDKALSISIGGKGGTAGDAERVTVGNTGDITTGGDGTGHGSYGILAQSIGGGGGAGGFAGSLAGTFGGEEKGKSMSLSIGGDGGAGGDSKAVTVGNSGRILTTAADSVGLYAQSIGGGGGDGGFSLNASLQTSNKGYNLGVAIGGDGGAAGNGYTVDVTNSARIETRGDHSQGIQAMSIGGGGGNGGFAINATGSTGKEVKSISASVGGKGGSGGDAEQVNVTNNASIVTNGADSAGIQAQSVGGGGGNGGFSVNGSFAGESGKSLSIAVGGDGGVGGIGRSVNVLGNGANSISTTGDRSYGIQAQSIGGGGGNGGFSADLALGVGGNDPNKASTTVAISIGGRGGSAGTGGDVNVGTNAAAIRGNITTTGADAAGIQAQSIGGGGGNGGYSFSGSINLAGGKKGPNNNVAIAVGGGGGDGNSGGDVLVNHIGAIYTSGNGSHGIEAQSIGGGGGNGGDARSMTLQLGKKPTKEEDEEKNKNKSLSLAIGGNGGGVVSTSSAGIVDVRHVGDITTLGGDAHGIFAQSIGGGGGTGGDGNEGAPDVKGVPVVDLLTKKYDVSGKELKITVGGAGGASGDGNDVRVNNTGKITTYGSGGYGVFAQSIGGGGGAGGNGDLGTVGQIAIGGGTDTTGNGKAVAVTVNGSIDTYGSSAHGIFAQSIGGGGGAAGNIDRGFKNYGNVGIGLAFGQSSGTGGNGGVVTVNSTADIFTRGAGSTGIFAQSIGGGGGVAGNLGNDFPILSVMNFAGSVGGTGSGDRVSVTQAANITTLGDASDGIFAQSAGGKDFGKAVNVTLNSGNILALGAESNGIFAQSIGSAGNDNIAVNITNANSVVVGGSNTGAAVRFADGTLNTLNNRGTLTTVAGVAGTAIVGAGGNEVVNNFGTVTGSVNLGAGTNTFNNNAGATFNAGSAVNLGNGNVLANAGTISAGGRGIVQTMTLAGNLTQTGAPAWLFDIGNGGVSDRMVVNGTSQLGASVTSIDLNPVARLDDFAPATLFTTGGSIQGAAFTFGTFSGEMPAGQTFGLVNAGNALQLTRSASTGTFVWTGAAGNSWNSGFLRGQSNWARSQGGADYVYGTPGGLTDVVMAASGKTELGDDFTINSVTFANDGLSGGVTLGGTSNNTLTLLARGGQGITVTGGAQDTSIGANIVLGNDQSWSNNGTGVLRLSGENITGAGKNLTISGNGNTSINSAIQTGSGSLTKQGSGLLALNGANTYTGGTTVSGGTLQGNARSLQGNILNNAAVNFDQTGVGTYAGNMSGSGSLTKLNSGVLVLSGANSYTGGTTVSGGTLQGNTQSLQGAIVNQAAVVFDQAAAGTYAGNMSGAGSLTKIGGGTLVLSGANSYSGGTVVGGGGLQGSATSLQGNIQNLGAVTFDQTSQGTYAGNMSGSGTLTKQGSGLLVLGGANSYSGGTFINGGTLQGNTQSLQGNIVNQGAAVFDQAAGGAYLGNMSGSGSLTKQGAGLLVVGGTNTYTGGTSVNAGALLGNTQSVQGNIQNQAAVIFDQAATGTYSGNMSGTGSMIKQGSGLLIMGGANSYAGGTLVSAGTLQGDTRSVQGDILNQSAVVFDQTDPGIYAGNMAGAGSLTKRGIGAVNLTGDFSQFSGSTTIAGGLLSVNGSLGGGSLLVQSGGMLGGNGLMPTTMLQSGATLAPGMSIGTAHVNGDVTFSAGSFYRVETESYGLSDRTFAAGQLTANGGTVDVRAGGTRRYRPINNYTIFGVGSGIAGAFANVTSSAAYLNPSLQYDKNNVYLTLRRNDVDFSSVGTRGNETSVASTLNQLVGVATGPLADVVNNVYDATNDQAKHAINSMTGIEYQHVARSGLATAQMFMAVSLTRLGMVTSDAAGAIPNTGLAVNSLTFNNAGAGFAAAEAGNPSANRGWWMSGVGGVSKYRGNDVDSGATIPTRGVVLGVDAALGPHFTVGLSGGEASPHVTLDDGGDNTTTRMLQIGGYGRYRNHGSRFDAALSAGGQSNRTWRSVTDGTRSPTATASYGGSNLASQVEYGYTFRVTNGFSIEPELGFQYGRLNLDGLTEEGAGVLGLVVPDRTITSRRSVTGARLAKTFRTTRGAGVMFEGRASWAHEFSLIDPVMMRLVGDTYTNGYGISAPDQLRNSTVIGASVAGDWMKGLKLFAHIDTEVSGPVKSLTGNVGVYRSW